MSDDDKTEEQLLKELEELQQTKVLFEGLFEFAPDAIVVVDREGNIVKINKQAERIFGYSREEVLGKPIEILIPERFREIHVEQRREYMSRPRIRILGTDLELYGRKKDGSEFPVDIILGPLQTEKGLVVLAIVRDITEHQQMEEALRASELKYRSIFENAAEGIFQIAMEGRILTANPVWARMLGHASPEELIAHVSDIRKLCAPGQRVEMMRTIREYGEITDFEVELSRRDGNKIWVLINAHGMRDPAGRLIGMEGMAVDITNRKRAERNFQKLLESVPDAIMVIDRDFNIMYANTQTEKIFGYKREELVNKPYDILIPERFREKHIEHCTGYFAKPETKIMALHLGAVARRKDGSEFSVEVNMGPIETEEGIVVVIDIREIKRS